MDKTGFITLKGPYLDAGNRDSSLAYLRLRSKECSSAVVDIGDLDFIDSSGMGALLSLAKDLEARGGELVLARPTPKVKAVFDIVYLKLKIRIFEDVESAKRALSAKPGGE